MITEPTNNKDEVNSQDDKSTLIKEPKIYLFGIHRTNTTEFLRAIEDLGGMENYQARKMFVGMDGDQLTEFAGRVCYNSFAKGRASQPYHEHIRESGHGSVTEHTYFSFLVRGISRSLTHEFVRHRHHSPSQLSQRFVDSSGIEFVVPPLYLLFGDTYETDIKPILEDHKAMTLAAYTTLVDIGDAKIAELFPDLEGTARRKMVREAARCVLPNMTETMICMSGNARAWRDFLRQRGSKHADYEIRRLALAIAKVLKRETTFLFDDIEEVEIANRPGEYELTGTWEKE